jgi:hypothetical protein
MSNNINLSQGINLSQNICYKPNQSYFIHINKNDLINNDIYLLIQDLFNIKLNIKLKIDDINNIKLITKSELNNKKCKNIGKYLKSNKSSQCMECYKIIESGIIFKELNCKHRYHLNCIKLKLENDIYKQCPYCNIEHITVL